MPTLATLRDLLLLFLANSGRRLAEWADRHREPTRAWIDEVKETYR